MKGEWSENTSVLCIVINKDCNDGCLLEYAENGKLCGDKLMMANAQWAVTGQVNQRRVIWQNFIFIDLGY
jgi:hypothetical protein